MLTILIFVLACIFIYVLNLVVFINSLSILNITLMVFGAVIGMILINAIIAIVCCKWLPNKWFTGNKKIYNVSKNECRFYEKLGIKKWKDKNAEWGSLNGFRKNKVSDPNDVDYINRFILETNKGFINHLVGIIVSAVVWVAAPIYLWLPLTIPVALTSVVLNYIPVMILRYNMPRLQTLKKFAERKNKIKETTPDLRKAI